MAKAHAFDALVLVPNCDKSFPECSWRLLAWTSGDHCERRPMLAGRHPPNQGRRSILISVFEAVGAVHSGKMSEQELCLFEDQACPTCGSCAGMFTATP